MVIIELIFLSQVVKIYLIYLPESNFCEIFNICENVKLFISFMYNLISPFMNRKGKSVTYIV